MHLKTVQYALRYAELRFLSGIAVFLIAAACGPDNQTGIERTSATASMNAVPTVQGGTTGANNENRPAQSKQPRVDVSDDCLAFLMNKHQRANACESPTTGQ